MRLKKGGVNGFTVFELSVVAMVLSILALFLLDRVLTYQELAEKTAVEMTVMNMRTGLRYKVAEYLVNNQESEMARLVGENSVMWLDHPPPNYLGELRKPRWDEIPPGNWYFDLSARELCYRVSKNRNFVSGQSGKQALCLHVTALARRGKTDGSVMQVQGVTLSLVEQYRWF